MAAARTRSRTTAGDRTVRRRTRVAGGARMSGETEREVSGWTVDTLRAHIEGRMADQRELYLRETSDLRTMLQERYATQTKAVDAAFLAQQTAMQTALTAAETAVTKALESAEKAVGKAEVAAEKRFDAVNEFRAQLADQAATFMPRQEAEGSIARSVDRIEDLARMVGLTISRAEVLSLTERNAERIREVTEQTSAFVRRQEVEPARDQMNTRISELATRLDRIEGRGIGLNAGWVYVLGAMAVIGTLISLYVALKGG
jgi:hypothetical protein